MTRAAIVLTSCVVATATPPGVPPRGAGPSTVHILFIGNSLTTANDLPAMVVALAAGAEGPRLDCRTVAFDGYSLEDHWQRGDAPRAIVQGGWTVVVLQQGPSALPESQRLLRDYAKRFDGLVKRAGSRTALYMVWPSNERRGDFDGVAASYATAAYDIGGLLFPAGEAWRAAWRRDAGLPLYGPDGFHPSVIGSYLAALVIYQQISGRHPVGLPATLRSPSGGLGPIVIPEQRARLLQEAAAEADAKYTTHANLFPGPHRLNQDRLPLVDGDGAAQGARGSAERTR